MSSISMIQSADMSSGALGTVFESVSGTPRVHTYVAAGTAANAAATSVARKWGRPPRGEPR